MSSKGRWPDFKTKALCDVHVYEYQLEFKMLILPSLRFVSASSESPDIVEFSRAKRMDFIDPGRGKTIYSEDFNKLYVMYYQQSLALLTNPDYLSLAKHPVFVVKITRPCNRCWGQITNLFSPRWPPWSPQTNFGWTGSSPSTNGGFIESSFKSKGARLPKLRFVNGSTSNHSLIRLWLISLYSSH